MVRDSARTLLKGDHPMRRILIVEDVTLNVELLEQLLEDDFELCIATDGLQGVAMAAAERPDLILMDMSLPGIDGYEATRRIRANSELAGVIIIGLSAHAMSGDETKALQAGCNDYLTKPLDEDRLFEKLASLLDPA
jgi:CheY-like chemotaxis protein